MANEKKRFNVEQKIKYGHHINDCMNKKENRSQSSKCTPVRKKSQGTLLVKYSKWHRHTFRGRNNEQNEIDRSVTRNTPGWTKTPEDSACLIFVIPMPFQYSLMDLNSYAFCKEHA